VTFAPYTAVKGCGNDGPGAANMLWWFLNESPWAGPAFNLGVCNCRPPSQHSRCRAWDLGLPMIDGDANPIGDDIVRFLIPIAGKLGLTELIWDRERYSAAFPNGKRYTGVSPHIDHIHGAHTLTATKHLTVPTIRLVAAGTFFPPTVTPPPPPRPVPPPAGPDEETDDMATYIRLNLPKGTHPHAGRVEAVTAMHRRWIPANELNLYTFLGGKILNCDRNQWNSWTSNKQPVGSNPLNGGL
jgi:hypothetical protein